MRQEEKDLNYQLGLYAGMYIVELYDAAGALVDRNRFCKGE